MADLKSFAQPSNTTLYTDVVDTERGFHGAHAKLQHSDYAGAPVGAINLDNPGGATRNLTQWNGTAQAGFALGSAAYVATSYSLNLTNCSVQQDIGTGNPGFLFDANDFMDYSRSSNIWRIVVGGVEKLASGFDTFFNSNKISRHQYPGASYNIVSNTTAPVDQKLWRIEHAAETKTFATVSDANTIAVPYDTITRTGLSVTRRLHESSGRLLVGQGVPDDGATALQAASYSASNQPSLTGGSGVSYSLAANAGQILDVVSNTLRGGVTLTIGNTRIVVPVAGQYLLTAAVSFVSGASSGAAYLRILKNGTLYAFQGLTQVLGSRDYLVHASLEIPMLANDYISIEVVSNPNTNVSATVGLENASFTKIN
jgi:hypothetical protein